MANFSDALRVAIVGAGPAGFYAAELLLRAGALVDLFERLPAPFGLLRYGVAPDHQNIKRAGAAFEKTAQHERLRYFGNVQVGQDLALAELLADYDQVLFAVGAASDRKLGIPGEELAGSVAATSFVGWYNAHPDFSGLEFALDAERVMIVGMGNVALDVARILLRDPRELAGTDIADYALSALERSRVREVVLLGRRGPAQAAFDTSELKEIAELTGVEAVLEGELELGDLEHQPAHARHNLEYMATLPRAPVKPEARRLCLRFLTSPSEILGGAGRVEAIALERNVLVPRPDGSVSARPSGDAPVIEPAGMVVHSIGYQALPIPGLPFDAAASVISNLHGRVGKPGEILPRCYVVGWIKRGPVGLLGSNKADAKETVEHMLADRDAALAERGARTPGRALEFLVERRVRVVNFAEWHKLDALELARGAARGKLREKFASLDAMLAAL